MLVTTLQRLAREFTARDIMVPRNKLVCASDEPSARNKLAENPDFNLIPIENASGRLIAFLHRGNERVQTIDVHEHIVGDATGVLDLVDVLAERPFCFVIVGRKIDGYIHFSDLSNRIAEMAFYIIIQAVENYFVERVRPFVTEANLENALENQRANQMKHLMNRLKANRAELDSLHLLSVRDILKFARLHAGVVLTDTEIDDIYKVRNAVSHASEPFVQSHDDVRRLLRVKDNCFRILG